MGKRLSLLAVSVFLIAGCAGVEITRVKDNKDNGGIRFYRPSPDLTFMEYSSSFFGK
jgi:PBP1b-binding outer membrane lipoprotein LpoB